MTSLRQVPSLYFLDYIATGKNEPAKLEQVVAGVAEGCVRAGAGLIGGETAEMPGMYGEDDYDLAGFAVGVAENHKSLTDQRSKKAMCFWALLPAVFIQTATRLFAVSLPTIQVRKNCQSWKVKTQRCPS